MLETVNAEHAILNLRKIRLVVLKLIRKEFTETSTVGDLEVYDIFQCFTLEDKDRYLEEEGKIKVAGKTAIPIGKYQIIMNYSKRFQRLMPLLLGVPQFEGIRIHSGNDEADTEGCILVGKTKGTGFIGDSKKAFHELYLFLLQVFDKKEKIWIEVTRKII